MVVRRRIKHEREHERYTYRVLIYHGRSFRFVELRMWWTTEI